MDQSPKARYLRAKYIALERERQWYWRVYLGLKTCCRLKMDDKLNEDKEQEDNIFIKSPNISIPRLVEIQITKEVHGEDSKQTETIRRLIEMERDEAVRHMVAIHQEIAMNRLREIQYAEEVKIQENIKRRVQIEQVEHIEQACTPAWARRRHYYSTSSYDIVPKFGEEERLPNYKPSSGNHLDQGFKPWARRRHYYNQAQYEWKTFSNCTDQEVHPANDTQNRIHSSHWARRRHYYNVNQATITDDTFKEQYKPWARRRHYYNEARNLDGSDMRVTDDQQ